MNYYRSQIGQDVFVMETLNFKKNGTFLEIGAGPFENISNTYALDRGFGWSGISIDIEDHTKNYAENRPNTKFYCHDALTFEYEKQMDEFFKDNKTIDYLTIDLEPPHISLQALYKVPFDKYTFNVITFETDSYRECGTKDASRKHLADRGYILVKEVNRQDDFYIHEQLLKN